MYGVGTARSVRRVARRRDVLGRQIGDLRFNWRQGGVEVRSIHTLELRAVEHVLYLACWDGNCARKD